MLKIFFICFMMTSGTFLTGQPFSYEFSFDEIHWEFKKADVIETQTSTLVEEGENYLFYETTLLGEKVTSSYFFDTDGKLKSFDYIFVDQFDDQTYKNMYDNLKNMLTEKYGPIHSEDIQPANGLYSIDNWEELMEAVSTDHAFINAVWISEEHQMICYLSIVHYENSKKFFCLEFIRYDPFDGIFE
ncbi:hypothetical protein JXA84_04550 [candidate division WOR-3 bacterium]|nr:hypothetical protein [candidate division WOR-3 bacterium]